MKKFSLMIRRKLIVLEHNENYKQAANNSHPGYLLPICSKLIFDSIFEFIETNYHLKNNHFELRAKMVPPLYQKRSFASRISTVNMIYVSSFLRIWSHLLKKSLENFTFCVVFHASVR